MCFLSIYENYINKLTIIKIMITIGTFQSYMRIKAYAGRTFLKTLQNGALKSKTYSVTKVLGDFYRELNHQTGRSGLWTKK